MAECVCQTPPFHYQDYDEIDLGSDAMNADVSLETCRKCGTRWVKYLIEWAHYSKSTRWYRAPVLSEDIPTLTAENAKEYIEKQAWCFAGGDYYRELGVHKKNKPIKII